ncbi:MAG: YbbR-like domain-containing protein [Mahellales bacterium]|jgi:YbbR domain-containing protein
MIDILKNNLALKVISVLFAIILWAYVVSSENPISTRLVRGIDVDIQGVTVLVANNLAIINEKDYTVDVRINGRHNDIINIKSSDIKAVIEVGHINTKGKVSLPVSIGGLPENVEVVQTEPSVIELEIDNVIEVQVPVELRVSGVPKRDYISGQYTVEPDEIRVRGPESIVMRIKSAVAELNIDGSTDTIVKTVPIQLLDSDNNQISEGIEMTKEFVSVQHDILFTKEIDIVPNITKPINENYLVSSITATPKTLKVAGKRSVLDGIDQISTEPINLGQITQDTVIETGLIMPPRVSPVDKISRVKVAIKVEEKEQQKTITVNTINVENIGEGYTSEIPATPVEVIFKGPVSKVEAVTEDQIRMFIDGAGLQPGTYRLPINAVLPEGLEIIDWSPKEVDVIIKPSE